MALAGLSDDELSRIRSELLAPARAPALHEDLISRELSWFPNAELVRWFTLGDGCGSSEGLHVFSVAEALRARRELLLRDLGPPFTSASRFLPLMRCSEGLLIFDGAAGGLVLRPTRNPVAYSKNRMTPLPLSQLDERTRVAAPTPKRPPASPARVPDGLVKRAMRIEWLPGAPEVNAAVLLDVGETQPTSRQRRLFDELPSLNVRNTSITARIEEALCTYYSSIRGLTDYGDAEQEAESEPPLCSPDEIWGLISSPAIWLDSDDESSDEAIGFEISWRATFDDEHGVAVHVLNDQVAAVGTVSSCSPLEQVREQAEERTAKMPRLLSFEASFRPAFSESLDVSVSLATAQVQVNDCRCAVDKTTLHVLVAVMNRLVAWEPFEQSPPGADGITLTASLRFEDRTSDVEVWGPTTARAPRAHALFLAVLDFIASLPLGNAVQRVVEEAREYL